MSPQRLAELRALVRAQARGFRGAWLTLGELSDLLSTIPTDPLVCLANLGPSVPDPEPEAGGSIRA